MLVKLTKTQVIALVKKNGTFNGYMVSCKLIPNNDTAFSIKLYMREDGIVCVKSSKTYTFDMLLDSFAYYNASYETGYYPHFYMNKKSLDK